MQISIIGYGRMGKEVEKQSSNFSLKVSKIINTQQELEDTSFSSDEIAIEFSTPESVIRNIELLSEKRISVICGTTGWQNNLDYIKKLVQRKKIGFLYASNFSIGVNIFLNIVKASSKLIDAFEDYDVLAHEMHHKNKKDSPSGTALTMGQILLENIDRKKILITDKLNRKLKENEIHLSSTRGGDVIGKHITMYDSIYDSIEITHTGKDRSAYAIGALKCAQWLYDKEGFFSIDDYMKDLIK